MQVVARLALLGSDDGRGEGRGAAEPGGVVVGFGLLGVLAVLVDRDDHVSSVLVD
jgi:hypothetical protein